MTVQVTGREVLVAVHPGPGAPVRVGCGDEVRELRPGDTVEFRAAACSRHRRGADGQAAAPGPVGTFASADPAGPR